MSSPQRPPVGAWVWESTSFDQPENVVELAQRIGLDFLQLMVNDKPRMSHRTQTAPDDQAAALVGQKFGDVSFDVGVTSYSSFPGFATSIAEQFSIGAPQAYSPVDGAKPGDDQHESHREWSKINGPNGSSLDIVMGLASYSQDVVFGEFHDKAHTVPVRSLNQVKANMTDALDAALAVQPRSICYWSIEFMSGHTLDDLAGNTLQELLAGSSSSGPHTGGGTYTVEPGDTLNKIAAAHGVSLEALIHANPQISNPDLIRVGEVITIP